MSRVFIKQLGISVLSVFLSTTAPAALLTFSNEADFLNALGNSYYTEDFTGYSGQYDYVESFTDYTFAYDMTPSPSRWYAEPVGVGGSAAMGSLHHGPDITITITSGNVYAIGGYFFNLNDTSFASQNISLYVNDEYMLSYTAADLDSSFRGFITDTLITSFRIVGASGHYHALDNLTVSSTQAVPEPSAVAFGLFALVGAVIAKRKPRRTDG